MTSVPTPSPYETVLVDRDGGVGTITLHRPAERNTFNLTMLNELHHALAAFEADASVRAIVVTGSGRYFSAGADLSGGSLAPPVDTDREGPAGAPWIRPWEMRTPVIGAINGAAVGIGLTLPLTWDVRYAAHDATLGFLFTRRGVIPEWGAHWMLPRLVGTSRCMDLILSGRKFSGQEALQRGLVTQTFTVDEVLPAAQSLAQEIAQYTSPAAVAASKSLLYEFLEEPSRRAAWTREQDVFMWLSGRQDATEGPASFLNKRSPTWTSSKHDTLTED